MGKVVRGTQARRIPWKRGDLLGTGTFGKVYKAFNTETGHIMAVKQLDISGSSDATVEAVEREVRLLRDLDHPNIVRYLGTERFQNTLSIFFEFIPGVRTRPPTPQPRARMSSPAAHVGRRGTWVYLPVGQSEGSATGLSRPPAGLTLVAACHCRGGRRGRWRAY